MQTRELFCCLSGVFHYTARTLVFGLVILFFFVLMHHLCENLHLSSLPQDERITGIGLVLGYCLVWALLSVIPYLRVPPYSYWVQKHTFEHLRVITQKHF
jgi:hypothetical protein